MVENAKVSHSQSHHPLAPLAGQAGIERLKSQLDAGFRRKSKLLWWRAPARSMSEHTMMVSRKVPVMDTSACLAG